MFYDMQVNVSVTIEDRGRPREFEVMIPYLCMMYS